jgi:hypothetical protein
MNMLSFSISWASGLIPHDLVTWILGRDLMASDAELVERTIEVSLNIKKSIVFRIWFNFFSQLWVSLTEIIIK